MSEEHVSVTKLPKFAGNGNKFRVFHSQFRAVCTLKNCEKVLDVSFKKELPAKFDGKASVIKGSSTEILEKLNGKGYHCLYLDGGVTVQNFLEDDLVDELIITRLPIVLGQGIPLFRKLDRRVEFAHVKTEVFLGELVQSHYKRKRL